MAQLRPRASLNTQLLGLLVLVLCLVSGAHRTAAQEPSPTPSPSSPAQSEAAEDDPTKPVIYSLRNEYRDLRNGAWANTVIFRVDKLTFRNLHSPGGGKGMIFRFDVPINTAHFGTTTRAGLGDLYTQVLYFPRATRKFAFAAGSGLVLPTATNDLLGQGKVILVPTVAPVWNFPKSRRTFLIRFQNYVSVAGKSGRPDVNYFIAVPALIGRLGAGWWFQADNELRWNWNTKLASGISGFQIGRLVRGKHGIALKPEIPWGPGRTGGFTFKVAFFKVK